MRTLHFFTEMALVTSPTRDISTSSTSYVHTKLYTKFYLPPKADKPMMAGYLPTNARPPGYLYGPSSYHQWTTRQITVAALRNENHHHDRPTRKHQTWNHHKARKHGRTNTGYSGQLNSHHQQRGYHNIPTNCWRTQHKQLNHCHNHENGCNLPRPVIGIHPHHQPYQQTRKVIAANSQWEILCRSPKIAKTKNKQKD